MTNKRSNRASALAVVWAIVAVVLVLGPTVGYGQRSSRQRISRTRTSVAPVDPNQAAKPNSWESFNLVLTRNIFSRTRTAWRPRQEEERPRPTVVTRNPEAYHVLKGVVQENDDFYAFIENSQDGTSLQVRRGDPVARGTIKTLTLDGLEYQMEGKDPVVVRVGYDLEGGIGVLSTSQMFELASTPSSSTSTSGRSTGSGADESEILKRLMEQRKQQVGQ
ncbi:MAG TPA: hypothetical protein PKH24_07710 [Sedimentisphaerales bacterium]|jgi:hypothetical protein|nr:hypothetical protein [Sedimentisphaerales bacterium]HNU29150.1 hypothetical protein [Sedimentisphaerales bacterium]